MTSSTREVAIRARKGSHVVLFTDRSVRSLPPGNGRRKDYRDRVRRGLTLRVSPDGARVYAVVYPFQGRVRRFTLGSIEEMTLAEARRRAAQAIGDVAKDLDPQARRVEEREAIQRDAEGPTFTALCEAFLAKNKARLRPVTLDAWDRIVRVEIAPSSLGSQAPHVIQRREVREFVEGIAESGRGYWANRVFEVIRRVFSWAVERDLVQGSPCLGLRKPHTEEPRDRVLTPDEIRSLWHVLGALSPENGLAEVREQLLRQAVKLLLCTGARRGEVLSMAWAEVDLEEKLWRIPAANTKQGATHVVTLNRLALDVLEGLRGRTNPEERFVFPSPEGSTRPFITNPQRMAQSIRDESGVVFRLHDIRRTVRDNLTRLGVLEHVAEAVIGHVEPSLVRRYSPPDPNKYLVEKRQALERWSRRLGEIVAGATKADKVVSIRGTHG